MNWFNNLTKLQKVILILIAGVVAVTGLSNLSNTSQDYYVANAVSTAFFWTILLLVLSSPLLYLTRKKESNINQSEKKSKSLRPLLIILIILVGALFLSAIIFFQREESNVSNNQTEPPRKATSRLSLAENLSMENVSVELRDIVTKQAWLKGTIKNKHSKKATNIKVRLDFYRGKESKDLFYTTYGTVPSVEANGAYPFNIWLQDFPIEVKQYTFTHNIESADFY